MTVLSPYISTQRTEKSRLQETDFSKLEFGKYISDHMLICRFSQGQWQEMRIMPFGEIPLTPAILSLHYGQSVFEGLKAFLNKEGNICIFRPHKHSDRLNKSLDRLCMPSIPQEMFLQSLHSLIEFDKAWIPRDEGSSLYIRPVVFATESRFGVKISDEYLYVVMTSPVGPYFSKPLRLKVEDTFVRAAEGGTGYAKCAGNYGGAFYPTHIARQEGFDQVLWTDAKEHRYIDEAGVMNVFFLLNNKLVTPHLNSAILDGVTRDSIIKLAPSLDMEVEQRKISVEELVDGFEKGIIKEAFGPGTAAVVSPIATINIQGVDYHLPEVTENSFQLKVKEKLNGIRMGTEEDIHHWNYTIKL